MHKFSFFKGGIKKTAPADALTIEQAVSLIASNEYKGTIELLRTSADKRSQKTIKDNLDYFTFSGTFKKRIASGLIQHSGYLCLDFDNVDIHETKKILSQQDFTMACFISPSGNGIKAIVKIVSEQHLQYFLALERYFEKLKLQVDKSGKDVCRACYVSYDPDIYYNPYSGLPNLALNDLPQNPQTEIPKQGALLSASKKFQINKNLERAIHVIEQAEATNIDLTGDYSDWQLIAFSLATFGEQGRELFHRVSKIYSEYNAQEAEAKFNDALAKGKFTTPAKFFSLAKDYGLETKMPKTIAEKQDELTYMELLGDQEHADNMTTFGFYEKGGCYYSMDLKGKVQQISNFKMRIIYHVETSDEEAYRLIQIKNIFGFDVVIKMNTDDFVSVAAFKKIIARKGNFIFKGSDADLCRLQDALQRDEVKTELVKQLGYSKRYNMYAFANGIYDCHLKEFKPISDLGIIEHFRLVDDEMIPFNFFIPAMSKMYNDKDDLYVGHKKFLLVQNDISFKDWAHLFCKVYGSNGHISLAFYLNALFSDIVFKAMDDRFPMLNVYGQKGTGKGTMIESMMKLFGLGQKQLMLGGASTVVGMMRKSGQYSNALLWMDEYKNNLKQTHIESLKNIYDRIGYERGKKDNTLETESTRIDSACIVSGQEMPIVEEALFSRFIMVITQKPSKTEEARKLFDTLKNIEADGLSSITVYLLKHRNYLADNYKAAYKSEQKALSTAVNNAEIDDRFINNYAALIAMCTLIKEVETLPFNIKEFRELCKKTLVDQYYVLKGSDAVGKWWNIIEVLFGDNTIREDKHFKIANAKLYIRVQDVYQFYAEAMQKRKDAGVLDEATLKNYLENDPKNFIERKKVFFGGAQKWCFVFDYVGLGIDLIAADNSLLLAQKYRDYGINYTDLEDEQQPVLIENKADLPF